MVLVGLLSVALTSVETKSLDMTAFAKEVASRNKTAALICAPAALQIKADLAISDIDTFLENARQQGFSFLRSDVAIGSQSGLPPSKHGVLAQWLGGNQYGGASFATVNLPIESLKDGKVSFTARPGELLSVRSIGSIKFAKTANISAYFISNQTDFPVAFEGKDVGEIDFLRALARGLGGTFRITGKEYLIGFDSNNFRKEALKLTSKVSSKIKESAKEGSGVGLKSGGVFSGGNPQISNSAALNQLPAINLLSATLNNMTPELIEQTFAYPNTTTRINLNVFRNLQPAVVSYLRAKEAEAEGSTGNNNNNSGAQVRRPRNDRVSAAVRGLLNRVDPRNPGHLTIQTDFRITLELNTKNDRNPVTLQVF
jgi:hypothetical protein